VIDVGFMGHVQVGDILPLAVQCRDGNMEAASPSSSPTYRVYAQDFKSTLDTGSLSSTDTDSIVGFRTGTLTIDTDYEAGKGYSILFQYSAAGSDYAALGSFLVD
jgi:hypothetical protein